MEGTCGEKLNGSRLLGLMYSFTEVESTVLWTHALNFTFLTLPKCSLKPTVDQPGKDFPDFNEKSVRGPQANPSSRTQLQDGDFWSCTVKYFQKGKEVT